MPLYRSLAPLSYTAGNQVINIVRSGIIFSAPAYQVADIPDEDFELVGNGGSTYNAPRATFLAFNGLEDFPLQGSPYHVYLDHFTGEAYRWSDQHRAYFGVLGDDTARDAVAQFLTDNPEKVRSHAIPVTPGDPDSLVQWYDGTGDPIGGPVEPFTITQIPWAAIPDKPLVIAAGSDAESARAAAEAARITIVDVRDWNDLSDDGTNSDSAVLNAAVAEATGPLGGVVKLGTFHAVDETVVVSALVTLQGRGGHDNGSRGTRFLSGAVSGPVVHLAGRSAGLRGIRILSTTERRAASSSNAHGVYIGGADVDPESYPFYSRLALFDLDIRDQPTDGVHGIGPLEMLQAHWVSVADCIRHGWVLDGGAIAGFSNIQSPTFMATLENCRAIECGGQALISLSAGGKAPQGLYLNKFDALGCAWDTDQRHTVGGNAATAPYQIQLGGRGHVLIRLDVEDQQYAQSATSTGGRARDALAAPTKGVFSAASGVEVKFPYFSSLSQSWLQDGTTSGLRISYPTIFAGAYSTKQSPAIQIPATCAGVQVDYATSMTSNGSTTVVQSQSMNARIMENGTPRVGLGSTAVSGWGDAITPAGAVIASAVLTTTNRRTQVNGEGASADSMHTIRLSSGLNGYVGMDIWLFRGSEDITITHAVGNIRNLSGRDIVMTATANTVLHYVFNGTNWVQVGPNLPVAAGAYTQTYSTADKTLGAYTPDVENVAYTGNPADLAAAAKLTDQNALRVAYENLRVFTEDLAQQHNSLIADLKALGLIQ